MRYAWSSQAILALAAAAWLTMVLVAPLIGRPRAGGLPLISRAVYGIGSVICHQRPERSFAWEGAALPVCGRCTGLYGGAAIAAAVAAVARIRPLQVIRARQLLAIAAVPTAITLLVEWGGLSPLSNGVRCAAGIPLGAAVAWVLVGVVSPRHAG